MKGIHAVIVICCWHLVQGYYQIGVIRDTCLENELYSTVINSVSTGITYNLCIPSPYNEKCSFQDITVMGWRCPGNSFMAGRVRGCTMGVMGCPTNSPFPVTGRMRCCTKESLEIKKCIVDPKIYNFDEDFVSVPPKGFFLKGRLSVGNPKAPFGYRLEFCSVQPRRRQY
ncbi:uncharacterized protein LOC134263957 [Saccostrea cucullata]|uniref:uncharacterized protein LOC134263957 n=1 Tax=Saccostrea cuccullata TaxID=36930 RepID=UPI002ED6A705